MNVRLLLVAAFASAVSSTAFGSQDAAATPAAGPPPPAVTADAVWKPPADFTAAFHKACDKAGARFGECFTEQMQKAGAPAAAVAFARRVGNQGYLRAFRDTGKVDLAFAEYPYRANENQLCLLVNGQPATIDVDDPALLDTKALEANTAYAELLKAHPKVAIFPGARGVAHGPIAQDLASGGQRFVVAYSLKDGCHACAVLGQVHYQFAFDVEGRFRGTEIVRIWIRPS